MGANDSRRELKEWGTGSKRVAKGLLWIGGLAAALGVLMVVVVIVAIAGAL